jgi:hypothetical protein
MTLINKHVSHHCALPKKFVILELYRDFFTLKLIKYMSKYQNGKIRKSTDNIF